jgi:6-pyruvoyltetrahydropterin/6-carboxytetrahydropterin synthase
MYTLSIKVDFPAAHQIHGYNGDCARPHGHNWVVEVEVESSALDEIGMGVDFRLMKKAAKETIAAWDHQDLNRLPDFEGMNPTAENVARVAWNKLEPLLTRGVSRLVRVTVHENDRCRASYRKPS